MIASTGCGRGNSVEEECGKQPDRWFASTGFSKAAKCVNEHVESGDRTSIIVLRGRGIPGNTIMFRLT